MGSGKLLASGDVARELGISRRSITRYVERGWLVPTFTTPGNRYLWDLEDVKRQLSELARIQREQRE